MNTNLITFALGALVVGTVLLGLNEVSRKDSWELLVNGITHSTYNDVGPCVDEAFWVIDVDPNVEVGCQRN